MNIACERRSCDSGNACDCLDLPQFAEWYEADCSAANATDKTGSMSSNYTAATTAANDEAPSLLHNVDPLTILVAIVTGMAMLALIALSVLFARYRKRNAKVQSLESGIEFANKEKDRAEAFNLELKRSLQRAQKEVDKAVGDAGEFLKQFMIKHAELKFEEELGHGAFGVVWMGTFRLQPVAIKTMRVTKVTPFHVREFMDELKLMAPLSHPNLVGLRGGVYNDGPDKLCLVLEFCPRGTVKDLLVATQSHDLPHNWQHPFFQITLGIAACFRYFHHEQPSGEALLHRDLKPENVLLADDFVAKVADLGCSRRYDQDEAVRRLADHEGASMLSMTMVGTPVRVLCCRRSFCSLPQSK